MELVRMGDTSVEAYEHLMKLFKGCAEEMKPFADIIDELGLEDKIAENGLVVNKESTMGDHAGGGVKRSTPNENDDVHSANEYGNAMAGLLPPAKRKEMGRPTTSREKAPYEGLSKRTRFCMICRQQGHKRTTCPDRGDIPKQPRKPARCKNCGVEGHRRNMCHKVGQIRMEK